MASQWQGSLLWWSFDPQGRVQDFVEDNLRNFVIAIVGPQTNRGRKPGQAQQAALASPRSRRPKKGG
jgi:hypothetical protein